MASTNMGGGFHETQQQAAVTLRDAVGLSSLKELPAVKTRVQTKKRIMRFNGVYWHKGSQAYTTRPATGKTDTTRHSANKRIGVVKKGLKASIILKRAQPNQQIYRDVLLGDSADIHQRAKAMLRMAAQEPCLEPLMLQLKYGPWRSALAATWAQQSSLQSPMSRVPSVKKRAQALQTALVTAVQEISKSGVSRRWGQNCGRADGRHSGGAPVLRQLGACLASVGCGSGCEGWEAWHAIPLQGDRGRGLR